MISLRVHFYLVYIRPFTYIIYWKCHPKTITRIYHEELGEFSVIGYKQITQVNLYSIQSKIRDTKAYELHWISRKL